MPGVSFVGHTCRQNSIAQDVTPQIAASHLGLFCLLGGISSKNEIKKNKITPDTPQNESRLAQLIKLGKSIRQIWVKKTRDALYYRLLRSWSAPLFLHMKTVNFLAHMLNTLTTIREETSGYQRKDYTTNWAKSHCTLYILQ